MPFYPLFRIPVTMKILIVEDDFLSRKLLNTFLSPYGEIDNAANGREAVEAVSVALAENWHYDLIFLDIMMPVLDGQDTLKKIRLLERNSCLTKKQEAAVIMTTALSDRENVLKAAKANCNGYLIKPLTRQKIIDQLAILGLIAETGNKND